jgi:hypothetical protein
MKLVIRPIQDQHRELDVTHRLVSAIAQELWRLYGGNDELNWLEAELHLGRMVGEAHAEASETELLLVRLRVPATTRAEPPAGRSWRLDYEMWPSLDRNTPRKPRAAPREPKAVGISSLIDASTRA